MHQPAIRYPELFLRIAAVFDPWASEKSTLQMSKVRHMTARSERTPAARSSPRKRIKTTRDIQRRAQRVHITASWGYT